ncbi:MAG: hypothetical protein ACOX4K_04800 [Bacillota bacterium]
MRKSLILTILMLALAAGSLCYVHGFVDESKDAVSIDETVLYGDKSIAEGITVDLSTHCDYRLFWDTRYKVGENPKASTDFVFSQAQKRSRQLRVPLGIAHIDDTFGGYGLSTSGNLNLEEEAIPVQDVASRAEPGKKHTEVVYIRDYYDFYPIRVEFHRPSGFAINEDTLNHFADFFKIPVYPKHKVEISVEKDTVGNVRRIEMSPVKDGAVDFDIISAVTETDCFFIVSCFTTDGKLLDTSYIPGGYGIYHFPLHNEGGNDRVLTADELQTVFAIDAERGRVATLQTSKDKSKLLLVTIEDGDYMLTVIDAATVTQLQKLEIVKTGEDIEFRSTGLNNLHVYEDFIAAEISDGRFAVLALDAEGNYQVRFTADFSENEQLRHVFSSRVLSMDYNGEELAIAAFQDGWYVPSNQCSFYLAVYANTGLAYAGHYQHSLDRSLIDSYPLGCRPVDGDPLTVTWDD